MGRGHGLRGGGIVNTLGRGLSLGLFVWFKVQDLGKIWLQRNIFRALYSEEIFDQSIPEH